MTQLTFKQFLSEGAKDRALIKRLSTAINSANSKLDAKLTTKPGTSAQVLSITTPDGKIPAEVNNIFRTDRIGVGAKTATKNSDGTTTLTFYVTKI